MKQALCLFYLIHLAHVLSFLYGIQCVQYANSHVFIYALTKQDKFQNPSNQGDVMLAWESNHSYFNSTWTRAMQNSAKVYKTTLLVFWWILNVTLLYRQCIHEKKAFPKKFKYTISHPWPVRTEVLLSAINWTLPNHHWILMEAPLDHQSVCI